GPGSGRNFLSTPFPASVFASLARMTCPAGAAKTRAQRCEYLQSRAARLLERSNTHADDAEAQIGADRFLPDLRSISVICVQLFGQLALQNQRVWTMQTRHRVEPMSR